jgi:hypothetical protein
MIERKVLIGLITSTNYLQQLNSEWKPEYLESPTARLLSGWCWEYFDKYHKAPMRDIEGIYIEKLKKGINEELANEIESEILPELSEQYENENPDIEYLLDQTRAYLKERQIAIHVETVGGLIEKGDVQQAQNEIEKFNIVEGGKVEGLDLSSPEMLEKIDVVFDTTYQNVIKFPGALGDFWNDQLVRGGFVSLMSPDKRGKTYMLLEFMMRAYKQKRKVAFFQAGDMTENQQLARICIYLAKKSNLEKYCGTLYVPEQDCIKNQLDMCSKKVRECKFGVFEDKSDRKDITKQDLIEALKDYPDYKPCYNCVEWQKNKWGSVWLKKIEVKNPLSKREAKKWIKKFFIDTKRSIKMTTYSNDTLTLSEMKRVLQKWKREENFVPDVVIIDYADLLVAEKEREHRHKENEIWKGLRGLSQELDALVITATQTDSDSYSKDRLEMRNFSEDKRKLAHVTAMYGLNQDSKGREKEIGVLRINKIVVREGDFHSSQEVNVLQRLEIGRPFLGSYY